MHLRGQTTTFQTRLEISEYAAAGLNDTRIAERVGCSIWTVRKWRRRSIHQGRVSLKSHMGRPTTGPVSTFPKELQETILDLRKLHPGWGPNTLLAALKMDGDFRDQPLPSRARLALLLKQAGLTRRYQPVNPNIKRLMATPGACCLLPITQKFGRFLPKVWPSLVLCHKFCRTVEFIVLRQVPAEQHAKLFLLPAYASLHWEEKT